MQKIYESELSFVESCLKQNPKSYGSWHHRGWVSPRLPRPDWARELGLCDRCLSLDERNCEYVRQSEERGRGGVNRFCGVIGRCISKERVEREKWQLGSLFSSFYLLWGKLTGYILEDSFIYGVSLSNHV